MAKADAARQVREAIEGKTAQRKDASADGDIKVSVIYVGEDHSTNMEDAPLDGFISHDITE